MAAVAAVSLIVMTAPNAQALTFQGPLAGPEVNLPSDIALGTATTSLTFGGISLITPDRGRVDGAIGAIQAIADTTLSKQASTLTLTGARAGDKSAAKWKRDSDSPNTIGYKELPDLNRSGVKTEMALGGWNTAAPERESAIARLGVLEGQINSSGLGMKGSIGERGMVSQITKDSAVSRSSLTLEGFNIDLAALLPVDLVALPFGMTYELSENLDLPMSDQLRQSLDAFTAILDQMALVEQALAVMDDAEARLRERVASSGSAAAELLERDLASAALAAALADINGAAAAITAADAAVAAAVTAVTNATQAVTTAQTAATAAQAAVTAASSNLANKQAELADLQAQAAADPVQAVLLAPSIVTKTAEVTAAQNTLTAAQASKVDADATLVSAQQALTDAQALETARRAARTAAVSVLGGAQAVADAARARLATAQLAYDAAVEAKALASAEIAGLRADAQAMRARLAVLFIELNGLMAHMPDLLGLHAGLLEALQATSVLQIESLHITGEASADAKGGKTFTDCRLSGVKVLGKAVPITTCADLSQLREDLQTQIREFLELLAGRQVAGVHLDGPRSETIVSKAPDSRGFFAARVHFTPFKLTIPQVNLAMQFNDTHARLVEITNELLAREDLRTMPEFADVVSVPLANVPMVALGTPTAGRVRVAGGQYRTMDDDVDPVAQQMENLNRQAGHVPAGTSVDGQTAGVEADFAGMDNDAAYRPAGAGTGGPVGNAGNGGNGGIGGGGNGGNGAGNGGNGAGNGAGSDGRLGTDGSVSGIGNGAGQDGNGLPLASTELPHTGGGASIVALMILLLGLTLGRRVWA